MPKIPKCKSCGKEGHYAISCRKTPNKPIKNKKPLKASRAVSTRGSTVPKSIPRKRNKAETRSQLKNKAWKAFSDYIRTRDSLATTGTREYCICITCKERGDSSWKPYASIQAGHAVGGRGNAVLFHEEIVNGQCGYCNGKLPHGLGGDYGNYAIALVKRYGLEHAEALQRLKGTEKQYKMQDFRDIIEEYKKKLAELK